MQFNLIFETFNYPKKHSIQTHVSQFNLIKVNIHSIQSRKYLFNPIAITITQSNHKNIYSIYLLNYQLSFNPFHSHAYSILSKTHSMQSTRNSFNLPGVSAAKECFVWYLAITHYFIALLLAKKEYEALLTSSLQNFSYCVLR